MNRHGIKCSTNSVYVASSWNNTFQPAIVAACRAAGITTYDFKDEQGFHWTEVRPGYKDDNHRLADYRMMLQHPRAKLGFMRDMDAMKASERCILVLPSGRSSHLEAGWFIGKARPTAIFVAEYEGPDLMYKMADLITDDMMELLDWLGVED